MTDTKAKMWTVLILCGMLTVVFLFANVPACSGIFIIPTLFAAGGLMLDAHLKAAKNARFREHALTQAKMLETPSAEEPIISAGNDIFELPESRFD